jgi:CubicO group peptidase (beta-lactamase class C family)
MKRSIFLQIAIPIIIFAYSYTQISGLTEAAPASVKVSEKRLVRIDKMLQQNIDSGWIAGAVGFIARDGKFIYNKSFGVKDLEKKTPMLTDDIFRIASQKKAITSIALMMLFEEGKFLLDDPISKYIPEFHNPTVLDRFYEKDTTYSTIPLLMAAIIQEAQVLVQL